MPVRARLGRHVEDRAAVDDHVARIRPLDPGDQAQEHSLARTGRAEDRHHLAVLDLQGGVVQDLVLAEGFRHAIDGEVAHARILQPLTAPNERPSTR